ncbi:hypothetical protein [Rhodanobacter panaciterrae]|uniref:hypothetical protein n=1 Tax=Rhodanobacter panaciterrae TaxID=490572 RepID=UPI001678CE95|nr:hypothetical protein [Rhodanobacter panaciterrae]
MSALLLGAFGIPWTATAATSGTATPQAASKSPSDTDLANTGCAIGEEKFLPADYYYCLATQSYGEHHFDRAQKFFATAASWASKPAQYVLGIMAFHGDHQPVNRALALAWLSLAAERPQSKFQNAYTSAYASATPTERQAAERLLASMRPTYADATAASRAERRYAQGMATLERLSSGNGHYCMEGLTTLADAGEAGDPAQCPPIPAMTKALDQAAANVFDGWAGHVTVGPLQQVVAPAPTSRKSG